MNVLSFLKMNNGLAATVILERDAVDWTAIEAVETVVSQDGLRVAFGQDQLLLPLSVIEVLLEAEDNPTLTLYPIELAQPVQLPAGAIIFRRDTLIEAKGMTRLLVGLRPAPPEPDVSPATA